MPAKPRRTALSLVILGAVLGCATPPGHVEQSFDGGPGAAEVVIIDRGWHTDIALPAEAMSGPLGTLRQTFPGVRVLIFGFGDKAFYMAREETLWGMAEALFPGPGVVLATALSVPPAEAFPDSHGVTLKVSAKQLEGIVAFVAHNLKTQPDGSLEQLGPGPYEGSLFYASDGRYDAVHDCNYWTLSALHAGGLPVDPEGVMFSGQVMEQVRAIAAGQGK